MLLACLTAARAGKHFFCEVPLSMSLDGTEELIDLVERQGLVAAPGSQPPFHPLVRQVKAWLEDPAFGKLLLFNQGDGASSFQFRWDDIALLEPTGRSQHPVGIPQTAHGETSLVRTQDFVLRLSSDPDGKARWLPLRVTFDIPKGRHTLPLIVGPFPPVLISAGEAAGHE